ncbi:T9SS type A sorting domain-containing protein [Parabacteroides sp. OttesenSCG-928-N08]|nr:T9SS type A sorting domain-containing protein [Parabacteroides sp. OttesenSCG-928-N08]
MMKRAILTVIVLLVSAGGILAQGFGAWNNHLAYYLTTQVAESTEQVYALANGSLYSYGKEDNSINILSKEQGLSDSDISRIAYNAEVKQLLIVYTNGNIDLMDNRGIIYNIPFFLSNTNVPDKTVNSLFFHQQYAYLATNFGVMVIDMKKQEISETYRMNLPIYSVFIEDKTIYAASTQTILTGQTDANLLDINNWQTMEIQYNFNSGNYIAAVTKFEDKLTLFVKGRGVYYLQSDLTTKTIVSNSSIQNMKLLHGKLVFHRNNYLYVYTTLKDYFTMEMTNIRDISALKEGDTYWIAGASEGLLAIRRKRTENVFELVVSGNTINSPKRNYAAFMTLHNNKLLVAGGDKWQDRNWVVGTLMVYEDNSWYNFDESAIAKLSGVSLNDVVSVAVDPRDETHYFASTWGEGVYEFKENEFVERYTLTNSSLGSTNGKDRSVRVTALKYDRYNNLWMTNSEVDDRCIHVYTAEGKWISLTGEGYLALNDQYMVDYIHIAENNQKWVLIVRGNAKGVFFLDDNGTIEDTSDDKTRHVGTGGFTTYINGQATTINASTFFSVAEDKNGYMWLGSNMGPIICSNPARALSHPNEVVVANRIVRKDEEGQLGYFLDGQNIRAIAVDGGNRKWLGTETDGLYVLNEDGSETLYHFTSDNSPLPSNYIKSLAINQTTGEVFIGTDKGIMSYMGGATEGSESYSEVYAYPNPVRPDYDDMVTITGLMTDSNVKITDLNGNILYQAKSFGGQMTWNCRKANGERVSTGIYLVMASQPDAGESVVTKIMVVK